MSALCASCGAPATKKCSACKTAHYCSSDCQKKDWPSHRSSGCTPRLHPIRLPSASLRDIVALPCYHASVRRDCDYCAKPLPQDYLRSGCGRGYCARKCYTNSTVLSHENCNECVRCGRISEDTAVYISEAPAFMGIQRILSIHCKECSDSFGVLRDMLVHPHKTYRIVLNSAYDWFKNITTSPVFVQQGIVSDEFASEDLAFGTAYILRRWLASQVTGEQCYHVESFTHTVRKTYHVVVTNHETLPVFNCHACGGGPYPALLHYGRAACGTKCCSTLCMLRHTETQAPQHLECLHCGRRNRGDMHFITLSPDRPVGLRCAEPPCSLQPLPLAATRRATVNMNDAIKWLTQEHDSKETQVSADEANALRYIAGMLAGAPELMTFAAPALGEVTLRKRLGIDHLAGIVLTPTWLDKPSTRNTCETQRQERPDFVVCNACDTSWKKGIVQRGARTTACGILYCSADCLKNARREGYHNRCAECECCGTRDTDGNGEDTLIYIHLPACGWLLCYNCASCGMANIPQAAQRFTVSVRNLILALPTLSRNDTIHEAAKWLVTNGTIIHHPRTNESHLVLLDNEPVVKEPPARRNFAGECEPYSIFQIHRTPSEETCALCADECRADKRIRTACGAIYCSKECYSIETSTHTLCVECEQCGQCPDESLVYMRYGIGLGDADEEEELLCGRCAALVPLADCDEMHLVKVSDLRALMDHDSIFSSTYQACRLTIIPANPQQPAPVPAAALANESSAPSVVVEQQQEEKKAAEIAVPRTTTSATTCAVCLDAVPDHVLVPCGHMFCGACSTTLQRSNKPCPICRANITAKVRAIMP